MLTARQNGRLGAVFDHDAHAAVETMWCFYQDIIAAYRHRYPQAGKAILMRAISRVSASVPSLLPELCRIGTTLNRRKPDILAYFDLPHTSNGPTEAINGRLENLRGNALGFRNLH